jgi:Domain of unknown function (DUF6438)
MRTVSIRTLATIGPLILIATTQALAAAATLCVSEITLERGFCLAPCRAYSLSITSDGSVRYLGKKNVELLGAASHQIPSSSFDTLVRALESVHFPDLQDRYVDKSDGCLERLTDQDSVTISATINGIKKTIWLNYGCTGLSVTRDIDWLARTIDFLADSRAWVEKNRDGKGAL